MSRTESPREETIPTLGDGESTRGSERALQFLKEAFSQGRPIVPFLGAGVSAGSGFPLTDNLREYLCKVKFFIRYSVYRRLLGEDLPPFRTLPPNSLEFSPARYLIEFGWPDFNRLTADLWRYAEQPFPAAVRRQGGEFDWCKKMRSQAVAEDFLAALSLSTCYLDRCFSEFRDSEELKGLDKSRFDRFATLARDMKKRIENCEPVWAWDRNRLASLVEFVLLEVQKSEDRPRADIVEEDVWKHDLHVRCDWFKLLHDLVEGRRGLADELLAQLNRDREPSLAHLMLAHLTRRLGWRLLLTLNHDSLLEKAFVLEGLSPKVFDINAFAGVPDAALLRREPLSVIKLHGSAFGLRLGETTNDEPDDTTRERLLQYIPHDAVLLVIGFSGYERRMMSLIESIAAMRGSSRETNHTILWMHWEPVDKLPDPVRRLRDRLGLIPRQTLFQSSQLDDAGSFLKGLYQRIARMLPATRIGYDALPKRVMAGMPLPDEKPRQEIVQIFLRDAIHDAVRSPSASQSPAVPYRGLVGPGPLAATYLSTKLSEFVRSCRGYDVIWIDLEEHHTVTGVVTEIITRMRVFDPTLPPLVLPVTDYDSYRGPRFARAARYVRRALRRGRYILAFDSVEGFGRPHTAHHGLTSIPFTEELDKFWDKQWRKSRNQPKFESLLYQSYRKSLQAGGAEGVVRTFRRELSNYWRLVDLLDFFQTLLRVAPERGESQDGAAKSGSDADSVLPDEPGTDPLSIDWYCCFGIDIPQPRHIESPRPRGPHEIKIKAPQGTVALSYFAVCRFCRHLTDTLGTRLYTEEKGLHNAGKSGRKDTQTSLPRPRRVRLTVIQTPPFPLLPRPEEAQNKRLGGDSLDRLLDIFESINRDAELSKKTTQQFIDRFVQYTLDRFCGRLLYSSIIREDDAVALFFLLCVFRRPRNLASVVSLVERLLALLGRHANVRPTAIDPQVETTRAPNVPIFDVDGALLQLREHHLLHLTEGELYFISQHIHEVAYKLLSTSLRLRSCFSFSDAQWDEEVKSDFSWHFGVGDASRESPNALLRAAWLGRLHSLIGRHYYVHIWQRAHDASALYEYLYHRMAALRYMMFLRARLGMLADFIRRNDRALEQSCRAEGVLQSLRLCFQTVEEGEGAPSLDASGGAVSGVDLLQELRAQVDEARVEYLNALLNVIDRERPTILASAPGDTWLNWVRQLLGVDLGEIFADSSKARFKAVDPRFQSAWESETRPGDTPLSATILTLEARLKGVLTDLEGLLYREMGAFEACIRSRLRLLSAMLGPIADSDLEALREPMDEQELVGRVSSTADSWIALSKNREQADKTIDAVGKRLKEYGSVEKLVHAIETAVIDIAASVRHMSPGGDQISINVLEAFRSLQRRFNDVLEFKQRQLEARGNQPSFAEAEIQQAASSLSVAGLRCEFELHRLQADQMTLCRFEQVDFLGQPVDVWKEDGEKLAELRKQRRRIELVEHHVFGAPFQHERDFILQVARFAALRATLLPLQLSDEDLQESLRLFEEAESGLAVDHPEHVFHRIIIHTQRAYTLMLMADAVLRRYRRDQNGPLPFGEYRTHVLERALPVAQQRLEEARAELSRSETILRSGRRNVRVWQRLYLARAQLAIEGVLRLSVVVEFDVTAIGSEHAFLAEIQEWLLIGLEAIRGALDCTVDPEPSSVGGNWLRSEQDYSKSITLYLKLFVAARVVLTAYSAASQNNGNGDDRILKRMISSERLAGEYPFIERWEALNQSVGLSRIFSALDTRTRTEGRAEPQESYLSWIDIVNMCAARIDGAGSVSTDESAQTLREFILFKINKLFGPNWKSKALRTDSSAARDGAKDELPWVIQTILHQLNRDVTKVRKRARREH